MPFFVNPWVLNVFYLLMGMLAANAEENQHPLLTVILFIMVPNLLFYVSRHLTIRRKKKMHSRQDQK